MRHNGYVALVISTLCATPTLARGPGSPACQADLARAERLIEAVAARDRAGPAADRARLCAVLRRNRSDMAAAAAIMRVCLTGHARGENVGQLAASIEDVEAVIARRCR